MTLSVVKMVKAATAALTETETDALLCGISTTSWLKTRHCQNLPNLSKFNWFCPKRIEETIQNHPTLADQPTGGSVSLFAAVAAAAAAAIAAAALVRGDSAAHGMTSHN